MTTPSAPESDQPFSITLKIDEQWLQQVLRQEVDRLLQAVGAGRSAETSPNDLLAELAALRQGLEDVRQSSAASAGQVRQLVEDALAALAAARNAEPRQPPTPPNAALERVLFGNDLFRNLALQSERRTLLDGLLAGEAAACTLAGELLQVHSAPADRMPQLLKDVGEAYYKWKPGSNAAPDPLEEALAAYLGRKCQEANLRNKIEIVRPGSRFNPRYHHSAENGVEVREVHGWVVLRGDGVPLYKASVTVK
jgi:hypothetical protein